MKKTVLVIDDEPAIREFLASVLSAHYQVYLAKDGNEGLRMAREYQPTVIILDIIMPGKDGIEVCNELRGDTATSSIPVIMLSALNETEPRTKAFLNGCDDYIEKPFIPDELLARVESKIRRLSERTRGSTLVQFGDLTLDFESFRAEISGQEIDIGQIELKILNCLIKHQGELVPREALHEFVWGEKSPSSRALDPHITTLRRKLKPSRGILKTVYGRGYSLILRDQSA